MKRKPLLAAGLFVTLLMVACFLVFSGIGLALFDYFLGNNVYALQVSYVPSYDVGAPKVSFSISLVNVRVPLETSLSGFSSHVDAASAFADQNFSLTIYVNAIVANNINVYARTFSFTDGQARTLTCYLKDYSASQYPVLTASINGFTILNGIQTDFNGYGGQWDNGGGG
jgi:hypothetical protein